MNKRVLPLADQLLTIQESADLLHVATKTLRRWEEKNLLIPQRSSGGHRRYTREQILDFKKQLKKGAHHLAPQVENVKVEPVAEAASVPVSIPVPTAAPIQAEEIHAPVKIEHFVSTSTTSAGQAQPDTIPTPVINQPVNLQVHPSAALENWPLSDSAVARPVKSFKQLDLKTSQPVKPPSFPQLYQGLHQDQRRFIRRGGLVFGIVFALLVLFKMTPNLGQNLIQTALAFAPLKNLFAHTQLAKLSKPSLAQNMNLRETVLGDMQVNDNLKFRINVPVEFAENAFFGKDATVSGTILANGGAITTSASVFNLVNTGATTLNLAGSATSVVIAATTGTTQIRNSLQVGNLTKINTVAYNFPNTQGASATFLKNDGAGNLTWETVTVPTLLNQLTGTLGINQGGTGSTSFGAGSVVFSDGSKLTESNTNFYWDRTNYRLGILNNAPVAALSVGPNSDFQVDSGGAIAAVTGYTQSSGNFLVSGPSSTVTISSLAAAGGIVTTDATGRLGSVAGTLGQCLLSNGTSAPTWGSCSGSIAAVPWEIGSGVIYPVNNTLDLLVGGNTSGSAKFAFANVNSGTPNLQISGNNVLTATTLGAGVVNSSLTKVGALTSGSIGNGFGAISTNNTIVTSTTITGSTVNGTTGINSGAGAGTQRIDSSGNLVNIGAITANGAITAPTTTNTINGLVINAGALSSINGYNQAAGNFAISGNGTFNTGTGAVNLNGNTTVTGSNSFTIASLNTAGGMVYTNASGTLQTSATGVAGLCLISGGAGAPTWTSCSGVAGNQFQSINGTIAALNSSQDFLIGGQSSASAKFGLVNVNSGTPAVQINGTTVITQNSLGAGVTGSSLTSVGALSGGSITNGFGTIVTGNTITGTTVNGTTGINTGAGAGTVRIDTTGNLTNIGAITASGSLTFSNFNTANGLLYTNGAGVVAQTTQGAANSILHGNGTNPPTWSGVDLTADVLNVLPISHGGTNGNAAPTLGALAYGTGTAYAFMSANATSGLCLTSGGAGAPTWTSCASASGNQFQSLAGAIVPNNTTQDFLVGGQSTASAKFGFVNVNSGTPALQIAGINVLTGNALGTGVTSSSLTSVGTLASGSIANGFGTITTANTITGTTLNGTTSVNTGTGSGTVRIDTNGNLTNIGTINASGAINGVTITAGAISGVTGYTQSSGNFGISGGGTFSTGNGNVSLNGNTSITGSSTFTIAALNTAGGLLYTSGTGVVNTSTAGISGQCLISGGSGAPTWTGCSGAAGNQFQVLNGSIVPINNTEDFLIGGQSTASAKFGFVNVNSGTPALQIAGINVLTGNALGTGVTGSSLTSVGTLASGSIANGFGTITTANTITGTTVNGTTGVNTGVGAGIQRIDITGSLVNINNLTASGSATFSSLNTASGVLYTNSFGTIAQTTQGAANTLLHGNGSGAPSWSGVDLTADVLNTLSINHGGTNGNATPTAGALAYGTGTAYAFMSANATSGLCLTSGGAGAPTWANCSGVSGNVFQGLNGAIQSINNTEDFLIGGNSTASSKFAVLNVNTNSTVASLSGSTGATYLTASGTLQTTNNQSLQFGGVTTGNILLQPANGSGRVGINNLTPHYTLDVNGTLNVTGAALFANNVGVSGAATISGSLTANNGVAITGGLNAAGGQTFTGGVNNSGAGITNTGSITGATGITSSGTITLSGLSTGVVHAGIGGVLSSGAVNLAGGASEVTGALGAVNGGTGIGSYATGDLIFASATNTLAVRAIGATNQVLTVAGGVPTWATISGAGGICPDCIVSDPNSTQVLQATSSGATGLSIRQPTGGTVDIFNVTDSTGATKYFRVDSAGNVILGSGSSTGVFTINPAGTDPIALSPAANNGTAYTGSITSSTLTQAQTWTFPNQSGIICLSSGNCLTGGTGISGSGTINHLSKFQSSTGLTDSLLFDDGTNIGIANNSPAYKLDLSGTFHAVGAATLSNNLGVAGSATVSGNLTANGATSLQSTLGVTGATILSSTLNVTGASVLSSTLGVTGNTTIGTNTLFVDTTGNQVGVGTGAPGNLFAVGSGSPFQINSSGQIAAIAGYTQGSGNFAISGTGTFGTGTGAISLNGNTTLDASKTLTLAGLNTAGAVVYTDISGTLNETSQGISGNCLLSGGSASPTWGSCTSTANTQWTVANGAIYATNPTVDLLIGGLSTASAKFEVNATNGNVLAKGYLSAAGATLSATVPGNVPLTVKGATAQTANLANYQNVGGTNLFAVDSVGNLALTAGGKIYPFTDTTNAINIANAAGTAFTTFDSSNSRVGILTSAPAAALSVGASNQFQVNSTGAIAAATGLTSSGTVTFSSLNTNNGLFYANGSGVVAQTAQGAANTLLHGNGAGVPSWSGVDLTADVINTLPINHGGTNGTATPTSGALAYGTGTAYAFMSSNPTAGLCLLSGGSGSPTWSNCAGASGALFQSLNGTIVPINNTQDFLVGGQATASAVFGLVNVNSGTPAIQINGTTVLTGNTLGVGVVNSSLTKVGALNSGSIASGFGTITTANNITGTSINGTVGINTGSGTGTQRLDAAGNLINIGNLTATGTATLANYTTNNGLLFTNGSGVVAQTAQGAANTILHGNGTSAPSFSAVDLTADVINTLPINHGGTNGTATPTAGAIAYGTGTAYAFIGSNSTTGLCLLSGGSGAPSWGSCANAAGGSSPFQVLAGAIAPYNTTQDFLVGGQSTVSAKFAVTNVNSGTPVASLSAGTAGATYFTADGTLATTTNQKLTIGGSTTGAIQLSPAATTGLFIGKNGSVGIGTTNVSNDILTLNSGGSESISFGSSVMGFNRDVSSGAIYDGSQNAYQFSHVGNRLQLEVYNSAGVGVTSNALSVNSSGYLGVGTNNAGAMAEIHPYSDGLTSLFLSQANSTTAGWSISAHNDGIFRLFRSDNAPNEISMRYDNGNVGIGNDSASSLLSVGASNQFQVNSSGAVAAATGITSSGTITFSNLNTNQGLLFANGSGVVAQTAQGAANTILHGNGTSAPTWSGVDLTADVINTLPINRGGTNGTAAPTAGALAYGTGTAYAFMSANSTTGLCLTSGGSGAPSWGSCAGAAGEQFQSLNGSIVPVNSTQDFLIGGQSTASAKFAFFNVNSGTPTASISGSTGATYLTATGTLATTAKQSLVLGNANTGNIIFNGGGKVGIGTANPTSLLYVSGGNITQDNGSGTTLGLLSGNELLGSTNLLLDTLTGTGGDISIRPQQVTALTIKAGGNVGVGGSTGTSLFNVGASDQFQVNSFGAIAAATGINSSGSITFSGLNTAGGVVYTNGSGTLGTVGGGAGQCLISGGAGAPSWTSCAAAAGSTNSPFQTLAGAIVPYNSTQDLLIGGQSTASAKFAFLNVNTGTPTASISGSVAGNALSLNGDGTISTTKNRTLALNPNGGFVGINQSAPTASLDVKGSNSVATVGSTTLLTADGTFATSTGWTPGTGWTIGGSSASHASGNTAALSGTSTATNTNSSYQVNFTVVVTTPGTGLNVSLGGTDSGLNFTSGGSKTVYIIPSSGTGTLAFTPGAGGTFVGSVTNVSIYPVNASTPDVLVESSNGAGSAMELRNGGSYNYNTYIGQNVGRFSTIGFNNTAIGQNSFSANTTGGANTAFGLQALYANSTGSNNTGIGVYSLSANINGTGNTALGVQSLAGNTTGSNNLALGYQSLLSNSSGTNNISLGYFSLYGNTIGFNNVAIGVNAGTTGNFANANVTGGNNTFLGYNSGPGTSSQLNNAVALGENALVSASNNLILGGTGANAVSVGIGTQIANATLDVRNAVGTAPTASFSGATSFAGLLVDQSGLGDIFAASVSGLNKFVISNAGNVGIGNANPTALLDLANANITSGNGINAAFNGLTSGFGLNLTSTSTGLTTGGLANINWSPSTYATSSGDLVSLNVGAFGTLGNIFNIKNNNSSVFAVSQNQITANLPTSFTAPGDVSMAYDLNFTNPTGSFIKSAAPLTLLSGESFNSDNLTLSTFNSGHVVLDSSAGVIITNLTTQGGIPYISDTIGTVSESAAGIASQCLLSGGTGAPTWGSCASGGSANSPFQTLAGTIMPNNSTLDFIVGGQSSSSARFGILNVNTGGTPVATLSATGGNSFFFTATGSAQTTNRQSLVLGGGTTGNISINNTLNTPFGLFDTVNGRLGLGTTAPAFTLDVNGTAQIRTLNSAGGVVYTSASGQLNTIAGLTGQCLLSAGALAPTWGTCTAAASVFQVTNGAINTLNSTTDFLVGGQSTASAKFAVLNVNTGGTPIASLSASGASGFYFTASGSAQTTGRQTLALGGGTTGNISINNILNTPFATFDTTNNRFGLGTTTPAAKFDIQDASITTGNGIAGAFNGLTTGFGLAMTSNSTALTTGGLASFDWSPSIASTASGDLVSLNVGPLGTLGNIFNVKSAGSSLFSISQNQITASIPTAFNAPGDATFAYDLQLSNPTGSVIKSAAPLTLQAGETFNSDDLTLRTFNSGNIDLDAAGGVTLVQAQNWNLAQSTSALNIDANLLNFDSINNRLGIGTSTQSATLDVRGTSGIIPIASFSGKTSFAGLLTDNGGLGDLFTASVSGLTKFTINNAGNVQINNLNTNGGIVWTGATGLLSTSAAGVSGQCLISAGAAAPTWTSCASASSNVFQSLAGAIVPLNSTQDFLIGGQSTASARFAVLNMNAGGTPTASLSASGASGFYFTASGSAQTTGRQTLSLGGGTTGNIQLNNINNTPFAFFDTTNNRFGLGTTTPGAKLDIQDLSITSGNGINANFNGLTSGFGLNLTSTSNALTTGGLANLDWSPTSSTTATGDLFSLNIGANGTIGNIFNIKNAGSSVFSVSQNQITANLPTSFNAAGDIGAAYDLQFTNPTASFIKSTAPLTLQAGETFNSSDLTLRTFNNGDLILDNPGGVVLAQAQSWTLASSSAALNFGSNLLNLDTTNNRVGIGTSSATAALDIVDQTNAGFAFHEFNNSDGVVMRLSHAGGTIAAPSALTANSNIFGIRGFGATSANTYSLSAAHIDAYTAENFTSTNQGTYLRFATTALGTTGALERMRIDSNGAIGIGTAGAAELGTLDVRSVLGTIPVASFSGSTSFATLLTDNSGIGDLFTASKSGATKFVINNAGNVGIGTAAPGTKLTIAQSGISYSEPALGTGTGSFSILGDTGNYGLFGGVVSNGNTWLQAMRKDATATAYNLELNPSGGFVGVGTTTPLYGLDVQNNQGSTAAAQIFNTNNGASTVGLNIKLGFTGTGSTTNSFIMFMNGNGTRSGRIASTGSNGVQFQSGNADLAEYFTKADAAANLPTGTLICEGVNGVQACQLGSTQSIVGVVSETSAFLGGTEGPNKVIVGLTGQVALRVNTEQGPIKAGDLISMSSVNGVGAKVSRAGAYVGIALSDYNNTDPTQVGTIQVNVRPSFTDPDVSLTKSDVANYTLSQMIDGSFVVNTPVGQLVNKVVTASDAVIGNLTVGKITAKSIQTDSLQIGTLSLDQYIAQVVSGLNANTATGSSTLASSSTTAPTATVSATIANSVQTILATSSAQIASGAAQVRVKLADLQTTTNDVVINANALYLSQYFETAGNAFIGNNLGVNNSAVFGKGLVVNDAGIEFLNTVATADQKFNLLGVMQLDAAGQVSIKGDLTVHGRITTDDPDVAGFAKVKAGDSSVAITFSRPYATVPVITATPDDSATQFTIINKSVNGFTLQLKAPAAADTTFNWTAISILSAKTFLSPSATVSAGVSGSGQVAGTSTSSATLP